MVHSHVFEIWNALSDRTELSSAASLWRPAAVWFPRCIIIIMVYNIKPKVKVYCHLCRKRRVILYIVILLHLAVKQYVGGMHPLFHPSTQSSIINQSSLLPHWSKPPSIHLSDPFTTYTFIHPTRAAFRITNCLTQLITHCLTHTHTHNTCTHANTHAVTHTHAIKFKLQ